MNTQDYKLPDGRSVNEMTEAEREEHEHARAVVQDGKPLEDADLEQVAGGLTFRETKWDRFRLLNYAFWNGEMDVMGDIISGVPLKDISWRP